MLAVHLTRDPWIVTGEPDRARKRWASELECLADLVEMGLSHQAVEMAHHLGHAASIKEGVMP